MKYVKLSDFTGELQTDETLLMSLDEFNAGGKDIRNVPVCVTKTGEEPAETEPEF